MSDYKELIGDIGDCLIAHPSETLCKRILREAADAIEQLIKERNAAVKDMNTLCSTFADICSFCKNDSRNDGDVCVKCKGTDWLEFWEWRGVQEEDNDGKID